MGRIASKLMRQRSIAHVTRLIRVCYVIVKRMLEQEETTRNHWDNYDS